MARSDRPGRTICLPLSNNWAAKPKSNRRVSSATVLHLCRCGHFRVIPRRGAVLSLRNSVNLSFQKTAFQICHTHVSHGCVTWKYMSTSIRVRISESGKQVNPRARLATLRLSYSSGSSWSFSGPELLQQYRYLGRFTRILVFFVHPHCCLTHQRPYTTWKAFIFVPSFQSIRCQLDRASIESKGLYVIGNPDFGFQPQAWETPSSIL